MVSSIIYRFENQEDFEEFQANIGMSIFEDTKEIWYPEPPTSDLEDLFE
jgi:hypothetical protein